MTSFAEHTRRITDILQNKLAMLVFGAGAFLWAATILILFLQFVVFLKGGQWPNWVLLDLICSVLPTPFLLWIASPQDWYGLHKVAYMVLESSLPLVTFILAFLLVIGGIKIAAE
jgi:hypothetical protein